MSNIDPNREERQSTEVTTVCVDGHPVDPNDMYCAECGGPVQTSVDRPTERSATATCLNGHVMALGHNFCTTCGAEVQAMPTSRQMAVQ